jgi:hypothetical protein
MKRPYDFEDIKARRAAGESWASIAKSYDRRKQAVERAAARHFAAPPEAVEAIANRLVKAVFKQVRREVQP